MTDDLIPGEEFGDEEEPDEARLGDPLPETGPDLSRIDFRTD